MGLSVGDGRPLPADGVIQIAFDRYLLPSTINRQSVTILDAAGKEVAAQPLVLYDPITRVVTLAPEKRPWLTEGLPYKIVFGIPDGDALTGGFRSIDRATLARDQPLAYAFLVVSAARKPVEPTSLFCRDVLPILVAKCNRPECHGSGDSPAAGLILDTSAGVGATALNRIAQGSNTGGRSGLAPSTGKVFGVDMPIIDPGNPGNSWLLYKIDLARLPAVPGPTEKERFACTNGLLEAQDKFVFELLVPQAQREAVDGERSVLSEFILGREMPFPATIGRDAYGQRPLGFEEREKVRIWIQNMPVGGSIPECGGCGSLGQGVVPSEGGTDGGVDAADASDAADPDSSDAADQ